MKILLATDGSEFSRLAVEEIAGRAYLPGTEVRILSVYETTSSLVNFESMGVIREYKAEIDRNAIKMAKNATEQAAEILQKRNSNLIVSTVVLEGSPKNMILKEAETFGADLIVVGSHGYNTVEGFLLGSVSQAVALHAKCSVEIVRKHNT